MDWGLTFLQGQGRSINNPSLSSDLARWPEICWQIAFWAGSPPRCYQGGRLAPSDLPLMTSLHRGEQRHGWERHGPGFWPGELPAQGGHTTGARCLRTWPQKGDRGGHTCVPAVPL